MKRVVFFFILLKVYSQCFGQGVELLNLQNRINAIAIMSTHIIQHPLQEARKKTSFAVADSLDLILNNPKSFLLNFDSFKTISVLKSDDNKIKILSFNYVSDSGYYTVFGFLLCNAKYYKNYFFRLLPNTMPLDSNAQELDHESWNAALYYSIFTFKARKKCHYLLTGFNGGTPWLASKTIEVLKLEKDGTPVFGAPVFFPLKQSKAKYRLLFKYSSQAYMTCRIEPKEQMIVISHLVPVRAEKSKNYEYYVPDGTYDYFKFKKGKWLQFEMLEDFQMNIAK